MTDEEFFNEHIRFKKWLNDHDSENRWKNLSEVWNVILFKFPKIKPPAAQDADSDWSLTKVSNFTWNYPKIYLEIEVDDAGLLQWYATDKNKKSEGTEEPITINTLSENFWCWIKKVASTK